MTLSGKALGRGTRLRVVDAAKYPCGPGKTCKPPFAEGAIVTVVEARGGFPDGVVSLREHSGWWKLPRFDLAAD